jgi:OTU domain-containing protein 6
LPRALADQLMFTSVGGGNSPDHKELRHMAADYIRGRPEEFAPFLELSIEEIPQYADRIGSDTLSEWGGQTEIKALCESLHRNIYVYAANAPLLKMGEEFIENEPLRVSFHKHYFALGEHYNSVIPVSKNCPCDSHDV